MNLDKHIDRMAARIERDLLPDVCTITTVSGTPTMSANGTMTTPTASRTYGGSPSIPCRLDTSRSFRPDKLPNQEINVNEYVLHIPRSVVIKPNDKVRVVLGGVTHVFEVRKFVSLSALRVTNEALIVELEGQHD